MPPLSWEYHQKDLKKVITWGSLETNVQVRYTKEIKSLFKAEVDAGQYSDGGDWQSIDRTLD